MNLHLRSRIRNSSLKRRLARLAPLLHGRDAWSALDELRVPGFGTHLLRFFFPVPSVETPTWMRTDPLQRRLEALLSAHEARYAELTTVVGAYAQEFAREVAAGGTEGGWRLDNQFFPLADGVLLYAMLRHLRPARYVEIGSGLSTRIANGARQAAGGALDIVSVDPEPRADIDALCSRVIRSRLEVAWRDVLPLLAAGDVLFLDGSHHCFPGSDVTHFFLNVLPELPAGVFVHVHDVFLPFDYPVGLRGRYWSEQYLLAAWLLAGGGGYRPLFPAAYLSTRPEFSAIITELYGSLDSGAGADADWHRHGTSFWMVRA